MADQRAPAALLVRGQVMHQRLRPVQHRFVYPVFYLRLNLARLGEAGNAWFSIDRRRLMSLRQRDYGPRDGSDLHAWMRAQLAAAGLHQADGEIWLQTFPRLFGFVFNPVSFWYCHDRQGQLRAVLAEVNNTFGEHHRYLLTAPDGAPIDSTMEPSCIKQLHVSPFCAVRGHYVFRFRDSASTAMTAIDYHDDASGQALMHTAVSGRIQPLTAGAALGALCRQPWLTVGIVLRIHWQALLLWRKRVPWFGSTPAAAAAPEQQPPGHSSGKEISS